MNNGEIRAAGRLLLEVIFAPDKVFPVIAERPRFLAVAVVFCGVGLLLAVALIPKVQAATLLLVEKQAALPPGQVEVVRRTAPTAAAVGSVVSAAVLPWVVWLVVAGLLKLHGVLSTRAASFRALFAVAVYGYLPVLIGTAIVTGMALAVPAENLPQVTLSLASFLPYQKSYLYFFLAECNPFVWWSLALWGTGGAAALGVRPGGPIAYLFAWWLVYALVSAGLAFLGAPQFAG